MKASQVFERILLCQYELDCTPPEHSAEVFGRLDDAFDELQSLTNLSADEIWDAVNERYDSYVKGKNGKG